MDSVWERIYFKAPLLLELSYGRLTLQLKITSKQGKRIFLKQLSVSLNESKDEKKLYDFKSSVYALSRLRVLGKLELVWFEPDLEEAVFKTRGKSFYQLELKARRLDLKKFVLSSSGKREAKAFSLSSSQLRDLIQSLGEVLLCSQVKFQLIKELEELKEAG